MKEDISGGRKDKRIELGMRFWKGEWITTNRMNTAVNSTKENVSYINKNMFFSLTNPFYRVKCLKEERN